MKNIVFAVAALLFTFTSLIPVAAHAQPASVQDTVYDKVDVLPQYPGDTRACSMFMAKNYKYPLMAQQFGVSGRVLLSFIIEKDGALSNIKIVKDPGYGTGEEAVRVLKLSPLWSPGLLNGRAVRVAYIMPVGVNFTPAVRQ